jgi:hypothetical protein
MEKFNVKNLNEVEGKEKYRVEISNKFTAVENLDAEADINKAWEPIRENTIFKNLDSVLRPVSI